MSDLKRVLMKRKEITSDEAGRFNQGGNAKPNISRSAGTKSSMHIRFKRLDLVWHLNKLAGGNSLKNK